MNVGGLLPFTMIDFPGKLSAVVFTQGCALRCPYCHNPELQNPAIQTDVSWEQVIDLLKQRQKLLDGVVFSGGEPLLQPDIKLAIEQVRGLGFAVALHTSGVYPDKLEDILHLVDWIGLDIKAPFDKYHIASGTAETFEMGKRAEQSLDLILKAGKSMEVRTTTDPRVVSKSDILELAKVLSGKGVQSYALQEYRPLNDGRLEEPSTEEIKSFYNDLEFEKELKSLFIDFTLRKA